MMSPFLDCSFGETITKSPSFIPAFIILSPLMRNANASSAFFRNIGSTTNEPSIFSIAVIGKPAATRPRTGIFINTLSSLKDDSVNSSCTFRIIEIPRLALLSMLI